ncbi:MAG TPA: hypothetical protein VJ063_06770 [Verrucomicrobiae bacterium]|nr:hypothetical protein [Verrucomicrobiae bacterium]
MKSQHIENRVVDEVHDCTYVIMATRTLTDGEMYSAIRVELLRRGGKFPAKGETLVIAAEKGM